MLGINEQEERMLQYLKQNDKVCVPIYTEYGPYWNELTVKRVTKTQIITADNQHFRKKDGSQVGGRTWCKRIYPLTEKLAKIMEARKLEHGETRQKRKLIFRIKRCDLDHLSLDQLAQIDEIMGDVEKCGEADVKPGGG